MNLRAIHECEKSENKMVSIEVNHAGVTFCGYCHKPVQYNCFFDDIVEEYMNEKGLKSNRTIRS